MQVVKMDHGSLALPSETLQIVGTDAQFTIIATGDTIILKKVTPSRLSEIAERAPKDTPLLLEEIVREVHRQRKSRHARRR